MPLTIPDQAPRCQYIRPNGTRCGSPALRRKPFCYYHYRASSPPPITCEITPLETADGIQQAITNVLQALQSGHIDPKIATITLYGLQTASSNLKRTNPQPAWDDVTTELPILEQEAWHRNIAVNDAKEAETAKLLYQAREQREEIERKLAEKKKEDEMKISDQQLDQMARRFTR